MRGAAVVLATVAMLLPGCVSDGGSGADGTWHAFEARYDLTMNSSDGVVDLEGALLLRLSGPDTIADRDGELRPAYTLEARQVMWQPGGMPKRPEDVARIQHRLDGDMLLVRTDCLDGVPTEMYECSPATTLDWTVKGSPAPFGLFWPDKVRYHVDGHWDEFDPRLGGGRHGMPPGHLLPSTMYKLGQVEFVRGELGVPDSFDLVERFGGITQTTHARLESLQAGDKLPAIEPWPMPEAGEVDELRGRFLPGETEEAFGMGMTFQEGFEHLLSQSPEATAALERSCGISGIVFWGGGAKPANEVAKVVYGNGDSIAFQLKTIEPGIVHQWEWRYQAEPPVLMAVGNEVAGETKDEGVQDGATCPMRPARPVLAVNDYLRAGWQLGLSGIPCGIIFGGYPFMESGSEEIRIAGLRFQSVLSSSVGNSPWDHAGEQPGGMVSYNAEDGRMDWLSASPTDLAAIDTGTLVARELPSEPSDVLGTEGFRCVPPNYTEPVAA